MRDAETVTFGGSALDRAAHLRGDAGALPALRERGRVLPLWRGKPLVMQSGGLAWLPHDHKIMSDAALNVFLGLDDETPVFAADLSAWQPDDAVVPQPPLFLDPTEQHHPDLPETEVFRELRAVMTTLTPREAELAATARAILQWHKTHGFCAVCGHASEVVQAGWQRTCPACGAHHFPRTDPVVIMLVQRGNSVLLGRSPGWPEGMYSCLAGFVEPGETIEAAVRREVFEEAGIRIGHVRYLASQPWPFPASLMLGCRAEALSDEIRLDPAELEDAIWVPREEMVEVISGAHPHIKPARKGAIAHLLIQNWLADKLD